MKTFNLGPKALVEIQNFQNTLMRFPVAQRQAMVKYLGNGMSLSVTSAATTRPAKVKTAPTKRKVSKKAKR